MSWIDRASVFPVLAMSGLSQELMTTRNEVKMVVFAVVGTAFILCVGIYSITIAIQLYGERQNFQTPRLRLRDFPEVLRMGLSRKER